MNFDVKRSPRRSRRDRDGVASMAPRLYGAYSTQDPSFFDDLDAKEVEVYKPFLKLEGDRLAAWRQVHPSHQGLPPSSVFNERGAFKLVADVVSTKTGLRSGGTADLKPAGDFRLKDCSSQKKEAFNYEEALLPNGPEFDHDYKSTASENAVPISSYSLPALKAVHVHFSGEAQRYADAVSAKTQKGFQFNWRGARRESERSLYRALRCKKLDKGSTPDIVAAYVKVLDAKIKEFEAAAAAA